MPGVGTTVVPTWVTSAIGIPRPRKARSAGIRSRRQGRRARQPLAFAPYADDLPACDDSLGRRFLPDLLGHPELPLIHPNNGVTSKSGPRQIVRNRNHPSATISPQGHDSANERPLARVETCRRFIQYQEGRLRREHRS